MNEVKKIWFGLKRGFVKRSLQAQALKEHIDKSRYPIIVTGDFNDTPLSYTYHKIRKGLNDAFVNSGHGTGFTYKGNYPTNRIDYILYDKKVTNSNFEILKADFSDHYPIMALFKKDN
jgi:endonuclease/exonuclease/phosphatase (EEP) superfamily protein YafD